MAYRGIAVYLDPASDMEQSLDFAAGLAASQGARLVGLDVCSDAAFQGAWRDRAIGLADLAAAPGMTNAAPTPRHAGMPIFALTGAQRDEIIAYILSRR